jgi:hypothetical protein
MLNLFNANNLRPGNKEEDALSANFLVRIFYARKYGGGKRRKYGVRSRR